MHPETEDGMTLDQRAGQAITIAFHIKANTQKKKTHSIWWKNLKIFLFGCLKNLKIDTVSEAPRAGGDTQATNRCLPDSTCVLTRGPSPSSADRGVFVILI